MNKFIKILLINSVAFSLFSGPDEDLMREAFDGNSAGIEAAIAAGADINSVDTYGYTALIFAAKNVHIDIVRLLLDRGANINAINDSENTALMHAAFNGHINTVRLLLDRGANINAVEDRKSTRLN